MAIQQNPLALQLIRPGLVLLTALLVTSCGVDYSPASFPGDGRVQTQLPPFEPAPGEPADAPTTLPEPAAAPAPPPVVATPPASTLLLASAREQMQAGNNQRAAATLERALRIAPNDPYLWHELAQVRLATGEWQQAIQLANKSRVLAGSDAELRRKNSDIIATASDRLQAN